MTVASVDNISPCGANCNLAINLRIMLYFHFLSLYQFNLVVHYIGALYLTQFT